MKQQRAFLGLASFYRRYVPDFAVIAAPLTDATRKGNPNEIVWNDSRDKAFQELKKRISTPPMLRLPDVTRPFIVQTDASHIGIGAVLLQEDATGEQRPVAFASQKLQPRESNYSTIERECLAIVWGVTKFQEMYMERNSTWKQTMDRYNTFVRQRCRTGDLCVGSSLSNRIDSYYGPSEEKTTWEPIVEVGIPWRRMMMKQLCVKRRT